VTLEYMKRVDGVPADNYCEMEWKVAVKQLTSAKMIAVMFEPECADPKKWTGKVDARLGTKLGFDLSGALGKGDAAVFQNLVKEINDIIGARPPAAPSNPHPKLPGRQPRRYLVWVSLWRGLA
jgi:hypothetical protein